MSEIVPFVASVPFQSLNVTLNGTTQLIEIHWNARDNNGTGAWYLDVMETDRTPILMGIKLVLGTMLGRSSQHPFFANNGLFLVDTSRTNTEAALDDLNRRVFLMYFTATDIESSLLP